MGNNRTTNNIFMRPLIIKLMIIVSVVLMYFAFLYSFILTIIPPAIFNNQAADSIVNFGWYSMNYSDFFIGGTNYTVSNIAIGCFIVIGVALVLNILIVFWYRKANFTIGKDKRDILAVFTIPFVGILLSIIVGLVAVPKDFVNIGVVDIHTSFMYQYSEIIAVDNTLAIVMKWTTAGIVILAIELLIVLFGVFSLVFFIFRILKKSKWSQNGKQKKENSQQDIIK